MPTLNAPTNGPRPLALRRRPIDLLVRIEGDELAAGGGRVVRDRDRLEGKVLYEKDDKGGGQEGEVDTSST